MGLISDRYHRATKSILSELFLRFIFYTEMKNKRALEIDRRANIRASSEKSNFSRHLVGFWRDLEDNQRWKYDELSPLQLLEKLKPDECPPNKDQLAHTKREEIPCHPRHI